VRLASSFDPFQDLTPVAPLGAAPFAVGPAVESADTPQRLWFGEHRLHKEHRNVDGHQLEQRERIEEGWQQQLEEGETKEKEGGEEKNADEGKDEGNGVVDTRKQGIQEEELHQTEELEVSTDDVRIADDDINRDDDNDDQEANSVLAWPRPRPTVRWCVPQRRLMSVDTAPAIDVGVKSDASTSEEVRSFRVHARA
jgi:hypothetical protein